LVARTTAYCRRPSDGGDARGDHGVGGVDYGVCDKAALQGIESVPL
jgi:hypothetical protein